MPFNEYTLLTHSIWDIKRYDSEMPTEITTEINDRHKNCVNQLTWKKKETDEIHSTR